MNSACLSDMAFSFPQEEDLLNYFCDEKDALYSLYEELMCSSRSINKKRIVDALKFLVIENDMEEQKEEILMMNEDDLCVIHQEDAEKQKHEAVFNVRNKICELLEEQSY